MRSFLFFAMTTLAHSAVLSPPPSPYLAPRAQFCANAPLTVAGTLLPRRSFALTRSPPFPYGPHPVLWCSPGTATYLSITISSWAPEVALIGLLDGAYADISNHIHFTGDGLVQGGAFSFFGLNDYVLRIWDTDNHQATFGVLGSAVVGILDYMLSADHFGTAGFSVFDGPNQVARGFIARTGAGVGGGGA